jgi:hypothetical protein
MKAKFFHRITAADFYSVVADGPHPDSYAQWGRVLHSEVDEYLDLLKHAKTERQMLAFFYLHRHFLIEHLRGGHGRWVIPQQRLGSQHVTDFMIGAANSFGAEWVAVELESPRASVFTKAGNPTAILSHAIRQITDWRAWLTSNLAYAAKPPSEGGLGLEKIRPDVEGLILIGRRSRLGDSDNNLRSQMSHDLNIAIHTYDYIADVAREKAGMFDKHRKRQNAKTKQIKSI